MDLIPADSDLTPIDPGVPADADLTPVDEWREVLDVNVTGPFLVCRAALPSMLIDADWMPL